MTLPRYMALVACAYFLTFVITGFIGSYTDPTPFILAGIAAAFMATVGTARFMQLTPDKDAENEWRWPTLMHGSVIVVLLGVSLLA